MAHGERSSVPPVAHAYRDPLATASARIQELERQVADLRRENGALHARLAVPGDLARVDDMALPDDARRRLVQRRIRALRRELRAAFGVRRYAASAVIAVSATAAFVVLAAESVSSWPLAVAILSMGAVARALVATWPGFDELEDRRRQLAALKSELDALGAGRRHALPARVASADEPHADELVAATGVVAGD
jgi:hypothetical protein